MFKTGRPLVTFGSSTKGVTSGGQKLFADLTRQLLIIHAFGELSAAAFPRPARHHR